MRGPAQCRDIFDTKSNGLPALADDDHFLPVISPERLHAYQLAKRANALRVMAEAVRWAKRLVAIQPKRAANQILLGDAWALRGNAGHTQATEYAMGGSPNARREFANKQVFVTVMFEPALVVSGGFIELTSVPGIGCDFSAQALRDYAR